MDASPPLALCHKFVKKSQGSPLPPRARLRALLVSAPAALVLSPRGRSVAPTGVVRYIGTRWLSPIEPARKACFLQRNTRTGREDRTP
jgi:hypothetical protein